MSPEARRAKIIESARFVFSQSGAGRTKIQTIADHAGITAPFLYQHFESREALFKVAVLEPLELTVERLARQIQELAAEPPGDGSAPHIKLHTVFLNNTIELIPLLAAAQFSDPIKGPELFGGVIYPQIRKSLVGLMSKYTGWSANSIELDLAMRALIGLHFGVALETVLSGKPLNKTQVAEDLSTMFGQGLTHAGSAKGTRRRNVAARKIVTTQVDEQEGGAPRRKMSKANRIDAILAAAREVFLQYGLTGARSKQIADKVGITEAFMFRLFTTKEKIYEEAILKPLSLAFSELSGKVTRIGRTSSGLTFMEQLCKLGVPFFTEYGPLCIVALFSELSEGQKYYRKVLVPHLRTIRKAMTEQDGLIEPGVNAETMRRAVIGAVWGVTFDTEHWKYTAKPDVTEAILTRLFTMGIKTHPAYARRDA